MGDSLVRTRCRVTACPPFAVWDAKTSRMTFARRCWCRLAWWRVLWTSGAVEVLINLLRRHRRATNYRVAIAEPIRQFA